MAKKELTEREQILKDIQDGLSAEILKNQESVFRKMSKILGKQINAYNFNGVFGSKNNTYVDSVRSQFLDFDSFFASWLKGLNDTFEQEQKDFRRFHSVMDWNYRSSFRTVRLLKEKEIYEQVKIFLERNFYKHIDQRIRIKPDESLWSIWFGYKLTFGLLIAPVKRGDNWTNDKSEIRKVTYEYWTIGHILNTGLIDPESDEVVSFNTINDFYIFYKSIIKRLSNSSYEQEIYVYYINYLKSSKSINDEPFLIPEFRYRGLLMKHEHRLDLTILNPHTKEFTGFEISPASSHMSVANLKEKQNKVNDELKLKWEDEMAKRNKYFETFGITTITFTDSDLKDVPSCFEKIKLKLSNRPKTQTSLKIELDRLIKYK
jgi:hypothetical protein